MADQETLAQPGAIPEEEAQDSDLKHIITRSVGFEQMSITAIESVEISRTSSADMDASSPAGTINMKTRSPLNMKENHTRRPDRVVV